MKNKFVFIWVIILIFGLARFINLSQKFYWGDEVFNSLRIAGIDNKELSNRIAKIENSLISAEQLRLQVQPDMNSSALLTVRSLISEDTQHPPLFYVGEYFWTKFLGIDVGIQRILPAIFSFLSIFAIFIFVLILFNDQSVATISALVFSMSPFQLVFAQQVREYSLWVLMTLVTSIFFFERFKKIVFVTGVCIL